MGQTFSPPQSPLLDRAVHTRPASQHRVEAYQLLLAVCLIDFLVVALSGGVGYLVVKHYYPQIVAVLYARLWCVISISSLLFFGGFGCYRNLPADFRSQLPLLFVGFSLPILLVTFGLFSLKIGGDYSRGWFVGWWAAGLVGLTIDRFVVERIRTNLVNRRLLTEKYAIYGAGENAQPMIERLKRHRGIEIVGVFDDQAVQKRAEVGGFPVSGGIAELAMTAENSVIDRVVIALPLTADERINEVVKALSPLPLHIDVGFDARHGEISFRRGDCVADSLLLEVHDRPLAEWRYLVKRCEDIVISLVALAAALPVLLVVALAVKLGSSGPILFRQERYGASGKVFKVLKFRTMYTAFADPLGAQLTQRNDPRVTPIGRFLRRTSLDELPQLFNVLRGEMSLVGPRPHPLSAKAANVPYHDAFDRYALRHRVKPGITGWAQVNGWRGETETLLQLQKRVEHDIFYIEHWSFWLDMRILARTLCCFFKTENTF
ncbi:MAG TPA: undecaprenyl-phosphate glucose phosphotransferase [Stellaceae bacterium]|nr:undecaprenyl-phosphate glucose phosphotransferase [Stellaceae bacterium]